MKPLPIILALAVCVGCQTSRTSTKPPVAKATPTEKTSARRLSTGASVELVAIRNGPAEKGWSANGLPLDASFKANLDKDFGFFKDLSESKGSRTIVFEVQIPQSQTMPSVVFRENSGEMLVGNTLLQGDSLPLGHSNSANWYAWYSRPLPDRNSVDIEVGVASGPWQTTGSYEQKQGRFFHVSGSDFAPLVIPEPAAQGSGGEPTVVVIVNVPDTPMARAFRVSVKGRDGKEFLSAGSFNKGKDKPYEFWFRGKVSDIHSVELQTRRYEWSQVPNVRLQPEASGV